MLLLVFISTPQSSVGMDIFQATRGVNARVATNDKAFVGIIYDEVYKVVYPNDNNHITMYIENNLPYRVKYKLDLAGLPIKDFAPGSFELKPNEKQLIEIQMLDLEEAIEVLGSEEAIKMLNSEEAAKGIFNVLGNISAEYDQGSVSAAFEFKVDVDLPNPEELAEIEALLDETQESLEEGVKDDLNNENPMEKEAINNEYLSKETEEQSDSNNLINDLVEKTDVNNANDYNTENMPANTIEGNDNN